MKTIIFILIVSSFLQTTILPLDLVLIILVCKAYVKVSNQNLYLAFFFGLLLSHLTLTPLGLKSILYLVFITATQMLSKTRLAGNSWVIIPLSFVLLSINQVIDSMLLRSLEIFPKVFLESILAFPILYLIRLWEERFIVQKEIKLKIS